LLKKSILFIFENKNKFVFVFYVEHVKPGRYTSNLDYGFIIINSSIYFLTYLWV